MKPQTIAGYEVHPAASLFPMMGEDELQQLVDDIRANGQLHPVELFEGKVLDGRNRLVACERLGEKPRIVPWAPAPGSETSPTARVMSLNVRRRHLDRSQLAMIGAEAVPLFEAEAKERQRLGAAKGGSARKVSAPVREASEEPDEPAAAPPSRGAEKKTGKASQQAAAATGVSARYVEQAKQLQKDAPELAARVKAGEMTLKRASKTVRKSRQLTQIAAYRPPEGKFEVISDDPPWPWDDKLDGSDEIRGGLPYPEMTIEQIIAQPPPADENCILWLWCPNAHLIDLRTPVHRVLSAWGFTPKGLLTWKKDRMGAGHHLRNITEQCVLAFKGKPFVNLTDETTFLEAVRGEHSAKPDEFFAMVEKLCPGKSRLELYARARRVGWVTSGAEAPKTAGQLAPPAPKQPGDRPHVIDHHFYSAKPGGQVCDECGEDSWGHLPVPLGMRATGPNEVAMIGNVTLPEIGARAAKPKAEHSWEKRNLVSAPDGSDTWGCKACPATFKRHGLGFNPPTSPCPGRVPETPKGKRARIVEAQDGETAAQALERARADGVADSVDGEIERAEQDLRQAASGGPTLSGHCAGPDCNLQAAPGKALCGPCARALDEVDAKSKAKLPGGLDLAMAQRALIEAGEGPIYICLRCGRVSASGGWHFALGNTACPVLTMDALTGVQRSELEARVAEAVVAAAPGRRKALTELADRARENAGLEAKKPKAAPRKKRAKFPDCYVCHRPVEGGGLTVDDLGTAHNACLNKLSPAAKKARLRDLDAARKKNARPAVGFPKPKASREKKTKNGPFKKTWGGKRGSR